MKKFKVKNRLKRKYTRHTELQSSFQFSTGVLPILILAVALATTLLMSLNLREHTVTMQPQVAAPQFSLQEALKPLTALPNLFTQPAAFVVGIGNLGIQGIHDGLTALGNGIVSTLTLLDPRRLAMATLVSIQGFFLGLSAIGTGLLEVVVGAWDAMLQSLGAMSVAIGSGLAAMANAIAGVIVLVFGSILNAVVWLLLLIYHAIAAVAMFIFGVVTAIVDAIVKVILWPFQMLGLLWQQIKPFFDILGYHISLAALDFSSGVDTLSHLDDIVNER